MGRGPINSRLVGRVCRTPFASTRSAYSKDLVGRHEGLSWEAARAPNPSRARAEVAVKCLSLAGLLYSARAAPSACRLKRRRLLRRLQVASAAVDVATAMGQSCGNFCFHGVCRDSPLSFDWQELATFLRNNSS
jgi:hypothetical protein